MAGPVQLYSDRPLTTRLKYVAGTSFKIEAVLNGADLAGPPAKTVAINIREAGARKNVIARTAVIEDIDEDHVSYSFDQLTSAVPGTYELDWIVMDGATEVLRYPGGRRRMRIDITGITQEDKISLLEEALDSAIQAIEARDQAIEAAAGVELPHFTSFYDSIGNLPATGDAVGDRASVWTGEGYQPYEWDGAAWNAVGGIIGARFLATLIDDLSKSTQASITRPFLVIDNYPDVDNFVYDQDMTTYDGRVNLQASPSGGWKRLTHGVVRPETWGAKGDGVADDTVAMRECIQYACDNSMTVRLGGRDGRLSYKITGDCTPANLVNNRPNFAMIGEGWGRPAIKFLPTGQTTKFLKLEAFNYFLIADFWVEGDSGLGLGGYKGNVFWTGGADGSAVGVKASSRWAIRHVGVRFCNWAFTHEQGWILDYDGCIANNNNRGFKTYDDKTNADSGVHNDVTYRRCCAEANHEYGFDIDSKGSNIALLKCQAEGNGDTTASEGADIRVEGDIRSIHIDAYTERGTYTFPFLTIGNDANTKIETCVLAGTTFSGQDELIEIDRVRNLYFRETAKNVFHGKLRIGDNVGLVHFDRHIGRTAAENIAEAGYQLWHGGKHGQKKSYEPVYYTDFRELQAENFPHVTTGLDAYRVMLSEDQRLFIDWRSGTDVELDSTNTDDSKHGPKVLGAGAGANEFVVGLEYRGEPGFFKDKFPGGKMCFYYEAYVGASASDMYHQREIRWDGAVPGGDPDDDYYFEGSYNTNTEGVHSYVQGQYVYGFVNFNVDGVENIVDFVPGTNYVTEVRLSLRPKVSGASAAGDELTLLRLAIFDTHFGPPDMQMSFSPASYKPQQTAYGFYSADPVPESNLSHGAQGVIPLKNRLLTVGTLPEPASDFSNRWEWGYYNAASGAQNAIILSSFFGRQEVPVWQTLSDGSHAQALGGPYPPAFRIDDRFAYRFHCYVKIVNSINNDHVVYFGPQGVTGDEDLVYHPDGSTQTNAYWISAFQPLAAGVVAGDELLFVGEIQPRNAPNGSNSLIGGVYRCSDGRKLWGANGVAGPSAINTYRWPTSPRKRWLRLRMFSYDAASGSPVGVERHFYGWNGYVMDGNEPSIEALLQRQTPIYTNQAAIAALTDSTGGTAGATLSAVSGSGADAAINDNLASLAAKHEALRAAVEAAGIIVP